MIRARGSHRTQTARAGLRQLRVNHTTILRDTLRFEPAQRDTMRSQLRVSVRNILKPVKGSAEPARHRGQVRTLQHIPRFRTQRRRLHSQTAIRFSRTQHHIQWCRALPWRHIRRVKHATSIHIGHAKHRIRITHTKPANSLQERHLKPCSLRRGTQCDGIIPPIRRRQRLPYVPHLSNICLDQFSPLLRERIHSLFDTGQHRHQRPRFRKLGYFRTTAARTRRFSLAVPYWATRANALRA